MSASESTPSAAQQTDAVQVVFTPSGKRGRIAAGKTVLQAAQQLGVDLDTICGGRGLCDRCQVDLSVGEFAKFNLTSAPAHLSPPTAAEREFFAADSPSTRRLGCQAKLQGDAVIDVPAASQAHRQVVRKRADVHQITVDPALRLYYAEVPQPNMHAPSGDLQRLLDALEFEWDLRDLRCDFHLLPQLQKTLRDGDWKVTCAVHNHRDIVALWHGVRTKVYGAAVDVGSTTIALHICDLTTGEVVASGGIMNPQIRFGEDLMSRVSYAMLNPGGEADMTTAVRDALRDLLASVAADAGVDVADVLDITVVGNPVMHHLLLGASPIELGGAPFALATDHAVEARAVDLGLSVSPGARVYALPCIAGHVGADAAAVTLSEAPHQREEITLIVDVGTNAEIVLGNAHKMLAASSPTGPAFEGAQITGGQRAAPGAIERVRIDRDTLEPKFRVIGCDAWSDEPGFAAAMGGGGDGDGDGGGVDSHGAGGDGDGDGGATGVTGICGSGIIEVIAEMYLAGIIRADGIIDGDMASRSSRVQPDGKTWRYELHAGDGDANRGVTIHITQNDVRAIQLAKAALYAGARLLMDKLGIDRPDRIRLAGAFGAHIDVKYALVLGMLPDCELAHVTSAGNAAGAGAIIALLDQTARAEIEDLVRRIQKVETAVEAKFQDHFVEALAIPHKTADYTNLRKAVALPTADTNPDTQPRRRKSRRRRD